MTSLPGFQSHSVLVFVSAFFLLAGFLLEVKPFFESARPTPAILGARWLLWGGTACLVVSVAMGFLQPGKSIMFRDTSAPFLEHRFLGIWTAAVFLGLSVWRFFAGRRAHGLLVLVWLSAFWILGAQIFGGLRLGGHLSSLGGITLCRE